MPDSSPSHPDTNLMDVTPLRSSAEPDVVRAEMIDRLLHAWQGQFTLSISPVALMLAFLDWGIHLANAPGKQAALAEKAARKWVRLMSFLLASTACPDCPNCIEPLPQDQRFRGRLWQ